MIILCLPSVGLTQCEVFLARDRTTSSKRLIGLDFVRLIPMMIARMIISLKKVAAERYSNLGLVISTVLPMGMQDGPRSPCAGQQGQ